MRVGKILIVGPLPPPTGGMATVVKMHVNSPLLQQKYNVIYLNTNKKKAKSSMTLLIYQIIKYFLVLVRKKPDIVHIHSPSGKAFYKYSFMAIICKLFHKNAIMHIHGGAFKKFYNEHRRKKLIKRLLEICDLVIVLGETWLSFFNEVIGIDNKKLTILNNSIYELKGNDKTLDNNKFTYNGIFIGRVDVFKGINTIIKVCRELKKRGLNIKFNIIGNGEIEKWREYAREVGVSNEMVFYGEVLDTNILIQHMLNSDFLILPSKFECFPMVLLEAMKVGIPIIASNVGSIPEIIEDGINGFLCNPDDAFAFVNNIQTLYSNIRLKNSMCQNNVNKAKEKYSYNKWQYKLLKIYNNALREVH